MSKRLQVLGASEHLICIIVDLLKRNALDYDLILQRNLNLEFKPAVPVKDITISVAEPFSKPDESDPVIFGVSGAKNKIPVFEYYLDNFGITKDKYFRLIDKSFQIADSSIIGMGAFVEENVVVSAQTRIGFGVSLKRTVSIGHHCKIGDFVDINPGAIIAGKVSIGNGTTIGMGAKVIDNITIGRNCIIGAGSLVTKDIPDNSVAYGVPSKIIRENIIA
ncbi:acetyltransferase [uncultured Christiangramia sp.]|uniref:acetyltransferase n=1 Tax=uncultured Christiangramia sp. TaxID=503836 RepID=UPI002601AF66|nr:acetyltransferase [uncultured Christiangramia sp.]